MNQNELEHLLIENLKVAKETRDYVRGLYQQQKWARIRKIAQGVVLLALLGVAVYFLSPYFKIIKETLGTMTTQVSNFTGMETATDPQ